MNYVIGGALMLTGAIMIGLAWHGHIGQAWQTIIS